MILNKELANISHLFENCEILKKFSFCDDTIFIDDEEPLKLEEYIIDINIDFYLNENSSNNFSEDSPYRNLKNDDIYSNCSKITIR